MLSMFYLGSIAYQFISALHIMTADARGMEPMFNVYKRACLNLLDDDDELGSY